MEKKEMKSWIIVGLTCAIIVVLLTQPIIVTQVQSVAWVTEDGKYSVTESHTLNEYFELNETMPYINTEFDEKFAYFPESDGQRMYWSQQHNNTHIYLVWGDIETKEVGYINYSYIDGVIYQGLPDADNGHVVWMEYTYDGSDNYSIYLTDMESNTTTVVLKNNSIDLYPCRLHGNYIVYSTDTYAKLWYYNITNESHHLIVDLASSGLIKSFDIYNGLVFVTIYAFDSETFAAHSHEIDVDNVVNEVEELGETRFVVMDGDWVAYKTGETAGIYSISKGQAYVLNPGWEFVTEAWKFPIDIYGGILATLTQTHWSEGYPNVLIVTIDDLVLFEDTFTMITNNTGDKSRIDIGEYIISWELPRYVIEPPYSIHVSNHIEFVTIAEYEEGVVPIPDIETQTVYNLDVIYALIILGSLLGVAMSLWYLELPEDDIKWI